MSFVIRIRKFGTEYNPSLNSFSPKYKGSLQNKITSSYSCARSLGL